MLFLGLPSWILLILTLCSAASAAVLPSPSLVAETLDRRYVTTFAPPANYRFSWGIDGSRCSYGPASGLYISRSQIPGATSITQREVNACGAKCEQTLDCGFFHPVQMDGGAEGNVICALYSAKMSKSVATWTEGTTKSGGDVVVSYGFTRSSPVTKVASSSSIPVSISSSPAVRVVTTTSTTSTHSSTQTTTTTPSASTRTGNSASTTSASRTTTSSTTTTSTSRSTASSSSTSRSTVTSSSTTTMSRSTTSSTTLSSTTSSTTLSSTTSSTTSRSTTSSTTSRSTTSSTTSRSTTSSTTSRSSTSSTTTKTSASPTPTVPMPGFPYGASLVQFRGCSSTSNTIPMFVNRNYPSDNSASPASTVWIVQHGSSRNFDDYFSSVYNVVGDAGVVIAPNFYAAGDTTAPNSWYQSGSNLAWNSNDWSLGSDAVSPSGVSSCSSFDVYDSLIGSLRDRSRYPNLQRIIVVAHSAGSAMMGRYGMLSSNGDVKYVLANSPAMPYFTSARPIDASGCGSYNSWGYGWAASLPRYVSSRSSGAIQAFRNWVARDIVLMTGDIDTYSRDPTGDQTCNVQAQGGQNRRDRGYAFWAYINLLAGTNNDVSDYYGYDSLRYQVTSVSPPSFNVRHCVVDGVGHDNDAMFSSDCGQAAINGDSYIPEGPGPVRP